MERRTCDRCNGAGKTVHTHIANGVCFACLGTGRLSHRAQTLDCAPEPVDQAQVLFDLREMYAVGRDLDAVGRANWIRTRTPHVAGTIAYLLTAAAAPVRAKAEPAFRGLLGSDWARVEAELTSTQATV